MKPWSCFPNCQGQDITPKRLIRYFNFDLKNISLINFSDASLVNPYKELSPDVQNFHNQFINF